MDLDEVKNKCKYNMAWNYCFKDYYDSNIKDACYKNCNVKPECIQFTEENNNIDKCKIKNINKGEFVFNMNNILSGFNKIENNSLALTYAGQIAIRRNNNEYVRYNKENQTIENLMNMVIKDSFNLIYIMPATKVEIDDIIKHKDDFYQVIRINDNELSVINIKNGSKEIIIKEANIMGISFYYKVVSLMSMNNTINNTANEINPMLLMMLNSNNDNNGLLSAMLMMYMSNQTNKTDTINPMMLMAMCNNGIDIKTLMMNNIFNKNN